MEALYYLVVDGAKDGPYPREALLDAGLERDTLVWFTGQRDWVRADRVPELAALLEQARRERKQRQQRRQAQRQVERLPAPGLIRWLSRAIIGTHVPAAVLFLVGTTAVVVAVVLAIIASTGEHGLGPEPRLAAAARIATLAGLAVTGLSVPLLLVELGLIVVFVWNGRRVVRVLSPQKLSWSFLSVLDSGGSLPFGLGPALLALIFATLFIGAYALVAMEIYRLACGLNRVRDELELYDLPAAPLGLSFYTAMTGLLLLAGPLSLPFFIMLPLWAYQTATTATDICEARREAVEGPPVGESAA